MLSDDLSEAPFQAQAPFLLEFNHPLTAMMTDVAHCCGQEG